MFMLCLSYGSVVVHTKCGTIDKKQRVWTQHCWERGAQKHTIDAYPQCYQTVSACFELNDTPSDTGVFHNIDFLVAQERNKTNTTNDCVYLIIKQPAIIGDGEGCMNNNEINHRGTQNSPQLVWTRSNHRCLIVDS